MAPDYLAAMAALAEMVLSDNSDIKSLNLLLILEQKSLFCQAIWGSK